MPKSKKTKKVSRRTEPIEVIAVKEEKLIFSWKTIERPFQKRDREFWLTVMATLLLVFLILFLVKEWFLIATIFSALFFYYVLTTVPPKEVEHRITSKGVVFDRTQRFDWEILRRFWIKEKWGHRVLYIETWLNFPRQLVLVINNKDLKEIKEIMDRYLPFEERSPDFLDKFSQWVVERIPLK